MTRAIEDSTDGGADLEEATRFLRLLDPRAERWTFQLFDDTKKSGFALILHGSLAEHGAELVRRNAVSSGVYVTVNETDFRGRTKQNIVRERAVFADLDGAPLEPVLACSLAPHIIVESSPGKFHAYWRVDGLTHEQFTAVQEAIAARFNGDRTVKGYERVMRLPGFFHRKGTPFRARILDGQETSPYSTEAILHEFPPLTKTEKAEHARRVAETAGPGDRHGLLISLAGTMRRRGFDLEAIRAALVAHDARHCHPPLGAEEIDRNIMRSVRGWIEGSADLPADRLVLEDVGNGHRFVLRHGTDMRFIYPWHDWYAYDGQRWRISDDGEHVRRAKDATAAIFTEARDLAPIDQKRAEAVAKWAHVSHKRQRVEAMLWAAQSELPVSPDKLDADDFLLNVGNGTFDLEKLELREYDRGDLITKLIPTELKAEAKCPLWEAFLTRVLGEDAELVAFLRRAVGYTLTGSTREQVFFLLHGSGNNGKSTFVETLQALMGDYARPAEFRTFLHRDNSDAVRNDLATLFGLRCVTAVEAGQGLRLNEPLVKQLTGGDTITARFLHKEFFDFRPRFKMWLAANHKPEIRGQDFAIWRRVMLVPFVVEIPKAERDAELPAKLLAELPGILNWAVRGLREWNERGLDAPQAVLAATKDYRQEMDLLADFLENCCEKNPESHVIGWKLRAVYESWCKRAGSEPVKGNTFGRLLEERGYLSKVVKDENGRPQRVRCGLKLTTNDGVEDDETELFSGPEH